MCWVFLFFNVWALMSAEKMSSGVEDREPKDRGRRLRPAHTRDRDSSGQHAHKRSGVAVVLPQKPQEKDSHIKPTEERTVHLKAPGERDESDGMLSDEVTQIQEVRYCLKSLREQMAARQNRNNNNKHPANGFRVNKPSTRPIPTEESPQFRLSEVTDNQEESVKLREANKRLHEQLKEMEKMHREERERLQRESSEHCHRLTEQSKQLQTAEEKSEERGQKVEELQRLLGSMEIESGLLKDKMAAGEAELLQLKSDGREEKTQRCAELEKEVAGLKEKIHHLDDMLKSQQRKVRHMIEQLQNSRTVIQERDRAIRDLEEKVAYLEAENREMHDHMEYLLAGQDPPPLMSTHNKPEVVYSKPLTPTTPTSKALPFIKVIEIKS